MSSSQMAGKWNEGRPPFSLQPLNFSFGGATFFFFSGVGTCVHGDTAKKAEKQPCAVTRGWISGA